MRFSVLDRQQQVVQALKETYDVIVIGGGITGAGVALDAASRGLSVLLLEMQDFAAGTSSRSTKLVHGGLRYLKQLQLKEVTELGRERAIVYENGPHVTTPIWMLLPFHEQGTFGQLTTALGLRLYDLLAGVKKVERRVMLSRAETIASEPLIKRSGLIGGGKYVEYRTDDARLTIEVLKAAVMQGATAFHYMKVVGFHHRNVAFTEVLAEDQVTGERHLFKGRKIVNAAGPWVDAVRKLDGNVIGKEMVLSKGVHLVFDNALFPLKQAVYFDTESDGRMIFAIPRDGKTYVGTTDTFYNGDPEEMIVTKEDKAYLLKAIHYMFPDVKIYEDHIESSWAGVRPLIREDGKLSSEVSRKDEIWQSKSGILTIAGGKLTGYRKMAQKIVDMVAQQLEVEYGRRFKPCITKRLPVSGGDLHGARHFDEFVRRQALEGQRVGLTFKESEWLARFYGTNVEKLWPLVETNRSMPAFLYAQLQYSMLFESALKPVDFFIRRTGYLFFQLPLVEQYKEAVIDEMAIVFQWTEAQRVQYLQQLNEAILVAKGEI